MSLILLAQVMTQVHCSFVLTYMYHTQGVSNQCSLENGCNSTSMKLSPACLHDKQTAKM